MFGVIMKVEITQRKMRAALLSVGTNSLLVVLKLVLGLISGSVSILSEAIHSAVDLLAAGIAFLSVRSSGRPADSKHPFGHGKYEAISGAVEALLIFGAAAWIIIEAVGKLRHPHEPGCLGWGVGLMGLSAAINLGVSIWLMKVGRETDSLALRADAWHLRTDVFTSAGVAAGLGIVWLGQAMMPGVNLLWVDPVTAIVVAMLIVKAAWDLTAEAVHDLLDSRLSDDEEAWVGQYLASLAPAICGFHGLRTRRAGSSRFVEFHLLVDGEMPVAKSHRLTEEIESAIGGHLGGAFVTIHVEPCSGSCKPVCEAGCLVPGQAFWRST